LFKFGFNFLINKASWILVSYSEEHGPKNFEGIYCCLAMGQTFFAAVQMILDGTLTIKIS